MPRSCPPVRKGSSLSGSARTRAISAAVGLAFTGVAALLVLAAGARAAAPLSRGVEPGFVDRLLAVRLDESRKVLADAVAANPVQDLALNRARLLAHNDFVNHRIASGGVTSQKGSGRCWMFAGFNVLRPQVMRRFDLADFEFSENHLLFWDKIEKANFFLQGMIDHAGRPLDDRRVEILLDDPLGDGGWWSYFTDLVRKYGCVPKEIMPETESSSSTGAMNRALTLKLHEQGLALREMARAGAPPARLQARVEDDLAQLYRILVLHLGEPPRSFSWRYRSKDDSLGTRTYPETLTPQSFFRQCVGDSLAAYVALFHYPGRDFDTVYSLDLCRNMYDRDDVTLLNVPVDSLKACALRAVLDSTAVWFAADIGQENYGASGVLARGIYNYELIYGTSFDLPKQDLIALGLITPNHAMAFVGADTFGTRVEKWLVENSWGKEAGDEGHWYLYDDWFDRYVFAAILPARYLSPRLLELARATPVVLPPWDRMRALGRLERPSSLEKPAAR